MIELVGGRLYQWETGRMLLVGGNVASEANAIQFANQGDTVALEIKHNFTLENGDPKIRIPDKCLQSGKNLLVYLVYTESSEDSDDHSSRILETKIFPVAAKPRPKNYIPIAAEEALGVVRRLTDAAKEAAQEAEEARVKAEAEKLYAIDAAETAATARNAAVTAKNEAVAARNAAVTAKNEAKEAAATAETESHNAGNEAARAEIFAGLAESEKNAAFNAAKSAEADRIKAETAETNAGKNATRAETARKGAEDASTAAVEAKDDAEAAAESSAESAGNAGEHAKFAEDAKKAAQAAAETAAEETTQQILSNIGAELDKKAEIDDTTIGGKAWSSKNIVETLCPSFEKSGYLVQCNAVNGYPLNVIIQDDGEEEYIDLTICGKNLYDPKYKLIKGYYINKGNGAEAGAGTANYYATREFIPVSHLQYKYITLNNPPGGTNPGMAFYDYKKNFLGSDTSGKGDPIFVPGNAVFMRFCVDTGKENEVQIEIGSSATDYEEYSGRTVRVAAAYPEKTMVPGIIGRSGVTCLYAYGQKTAYVGYKVHVSGLSYPPAAIRELTDEIEQLKNAVISMGGIN